MRTVTGMDMGNATTSERCGSRPRGGDVSLTVLAAPPGGSGGGGRGKHPQIRPSRVGKWRALVLLGVHVLIGIHIALWLVFGMTVSPVEPSEAMTTLRDGAINAGFVFFALALVSTLVFGRYFCGWGCHVVALQDGSTWLLKKMGIRPKPFRSRLLLLVPLGLALYMFVWPVFHREVVRPLLGDEHGHLPTWLGQSSEWPGWSTEFMVRDFWATFPPWYVAIPFFLVVGFGAVYFLGSKGFCTYGCPYGGFFAPVDRVAPGRIRVTDACEGCGHCTAVCTSNVRVHEEVRDYGMVIDPGCMKCMDCVSVCPNDALYFGWGKPAVGARPRTDEARERLASQKKTYDLTLPQELAAAVLFLGLLLGFRGMLNEIPLLMAVGMAGIGAFGAWKLMTLFRDPSVRLQNFQLKLKGRWRPAGVVFAAATVLYLGTAAWSGAVRSQLWIGGLIDDRVGVPSDLAFTAGFIADEDSRRTAERAIGYYLRAGPAGQGGFGWRHSPDVNIRLAYLSLVAGRRDDAEGYLRKAVARAVPRDDLVLGLVQIMSLRQAPADEIADLCREQIRKHPALEGVRRALAQVLISSGKGAEAVAEYDRALEVLPDDPRVRIGAAMAAMQAGEGARAVRLVDEALGQFADDAETHRIGGTILLQAGQIERGVAALERAVDLSGRHLQTLVFTASIHAQLGHADRAIALLEEAAGAAPAPASILHDLAVLYYQTGKSDLAVERMERAAHAEPENPAWASRLAGLYQELGRRDEAARWFQETQRRQQGSGGGR